MASRHPFYLTIISVVSTLSLVVGVAGIGLNVTRNSHAASPFAAVEAENGSLTGGVTLLSDGTASSGSAVRFGTQVTGGNRFISAISSNGHYFVDQSGRPLLVRGDSPWSMAIDISNSDADWYYSQRQAQGFNSVLFSAFGGEGTGGGDSKNFSTYDGLKPFVNGDLNSYNEAYWSRLDGKIKSAEQHNITVFLYVMDTFGENVTFAQWDYDHTPEHDYRVAYNYSAFVANRYKNSPNVVFMLGGDYDNDQPQKYSGGMDKMMQRCAAAIKAAAPSKLVSIQLTGFPQSNSFDYPGWTTIPDFSFVYTYNPSYDATYRGYNHVWAGNPTTRPALYMEGPYEDENNKNWPHGAPPLTLRKQIAWSVLSGSPGSFYGRGGVWQFDSDWKAKVSDTGIVSPLGKLQDVLESLAWYTLVPDQNNAFVTAGKGNASTQGGTGTVSTNQNINPETDTYATAAISSDGKLGVVYVPTARTLTINNSKLATGTTARWIDPSNATNSQAAVISSNGQVTTPTAQHADGTADWLLVIK